MAPRQSYGSITVKNEGELESLVPQVAPPAEGKKKYFLASALAAVALAAVGIYHASTGTSHGSASVPLSPGKKVDWDLYDKSLILSTESPINLGFKSTVREAGAQPSTIWGNRTGPLPTNSWYLVS
jgi:ferric-dicitrate binding protein FerR (iron transport regulator)